MLVSIKVSNEEMNSAIELSQEANTIEFMRAITNKMGLVGKAKYLLGMDIEEGYGFTGGHIRIVMNKMTGIEIELDADLVVVHSVLRSTYADPKKFKQQIVVLLLQHREKLEELKEALDKFLAV